MEASTTPSGMNSSPVSFTQSGNGTRGDNCMTCSNSTPVYVVVIQIVLGVCVAIGNILTAVALARCRRLKTLLKMLLLNQTITDTMFGFVFVYHSSVVYELYYNILECMVRYALLSLSSAVSIVTITSLSLERIVAVAFPYTYHKTSSPWITIPVVSSCWLSSIIVIIVAFLFADTEITECNFLLLATPTSLLTCGVPCLILILVIVACNCYLYHTARQQIMKIIPNVLGQEKLTMTLRMNMKATLTCISVVVPCVLLNTPLYLFFVLVPLWPSFRLKLHALHVLNAMSTLVMVNSVVNPLIYVWRMEEVRGQMFKILRPLIPWRKNFTRVDVNVTQASEQELQETDLEHP